MKKTLMVLTFALCATFVFAQTATPYNKGVAKASTKEAKIQTNYSSSIFTKDETTLKTVDFHATNVDYSTGVISGGLEGHTMSYDYAVWQRWEANSASLTTAAATYSYLTTRMQQQGSDFVTFMMNRLDTATSSAENGFMFIAPIEQRTVTSESKFNAYIRIDSIDASNAGVLDVEFFQYYYRYYDHAYIDYCTDGNTWNQVEINVLGVDVAINSSLRGFIRYTLPTSACANNLSIRIRFKSLGDRGNGYGYYWMLDDVSVIAADANRLKHYGQEYVEGNYAMVPQGLQINPAWYSHVQNNGAVNQLNVNATLYHLNAAQDVSTEIDRYNNQGININSTKDVIADLAGWINTDSMDSRGWYGYIDHTPHGTGVQLPTETLGDNYIFATLGNDNVTLNYDTMYYKVTGLENGYYRWGHDNGVLTYLPTNYWLYGYILSGGNWYVTDDPEEVHYYEPGYMATSRFTTDAVVPDGWVIRGVELVASPVNGFHSTGARISGVLLQDEYDNNSVTFHTLMTGANVKEITANDVNDSNVIGRNSAGYLEPGNYNTIVIEFPEQPALEPNTTYRVGYSMEDNSYFALAHEANGYYRMAAPSDPEHLDTLIYFRNNEATAKYANYFLPNVYQSYIFDPTYGGTGSAGTFAAYQDVNPMIRLLVGPAQAVNRVNISVECDSTDFGTVAYGGNEVCGETITPVEGSTATIVASTATWCTVKSVLVDGEEVEVWNEDEETGDINLSASYDSASHVWVYQYRFANVQGDHTIKFVFAEGQPPISIDPAAAGIRMNLQPNPATSVVNMNIEGVTGMVNCMLIDMSGRVVYNQNVNAETAQTINVSNLAKGAYFVRITNDKFTKVEKLIVR